MLIDVISVELRTQYRLYLRFEDGMEGEIDISKIIPFEGIFSPLKNPDFFSKVELNKELGTIVWENGADISPDYLYNFLTGHAA